ncbi:energy transducer TonB [Planctobacterium marinum]|nr:energy transducer TonB [Planctobacterium marinum]MCC2606827.1 energy transducer TonB [Planctobacterium marinum]
MTEITYSQATATAVSAQQASKVAKFALLLCLASGITLALFYAMAQLIAQQNIRPTELPPLITIDPAFREPDEKITERQTLPEKPETLEPPKVLPSQLEPDSGGDDLNGFPLDIALTGPNINTDANTSLDVSGGEARPVVRISPQYPATAARDGIEGWVVLSFSINQTGGVEDVEILDAEPKRVFNREAIRALRKWKYRPKVVDGKLVKQTQITVQLDFKLEQ